MNKKLVLAGIFLIIFLLVVVGVIAGLARPVDNVVNSSISVNNDFLTSISSTIDVIFDSYVLIVLSFIIAILLFVYENKKLAGFFALTMLVNGGIIYFIKNLVARVRPLGLIDVSGYSFPSGHATTAVVFFGLIMFLFRKQKKAWINLVCVLMMLIIAVSRLYLRVHWFSDVVGGIFLGLGILFLGLSFVKKI